MNLPKSKIQKIALAFMIVGTLNIFSGVAAINVAKNFFILEAAIPWFAKIGVVGMFSSSFGLCLFSINTVTKD